MQDEYISVEHLLLAMLKNRSEAASLLEQSGIDTDKMLSALQAIRGNQRAPPQVSVTLSSPVQYSKA